MHADDVIPEPHELPNKPLVEVIFELRWSLEAGEQKGVSIDRGFKILYGRYYDRVHKDYPCIRDLPASHIPEELTGHTVRHQLWKAEGQWPVIQLGPGIMTVNETEGYTWPTFRPRLVQAVEALYDSYPREIVPLQPIQVTLKYFDAVPFDAARSPEPLLTFLREAAHTTVSIEPRLFGRPEEADAPASLSLSLRYPLELPRGVVVFSVADGVSHKDPSVIWQIGVHSEGGDVPQDRSEFGEWLDKAHGVTDRWFFTLTRGRLMESFERGM